MTVATLTRSPEVVARKRGSCKSCPEPISPGQYISKVDGKGWMHAGCAADYVRHRENFDALNQEIDNNEGG